MEYNTQKYQFNQDGRDYVVSTGLVGNRIRITCQEDLALDGPFYSNEFTLDDLRHANQFFNLPQTPEEALLEIDKGIERQKSGLQKGNNDTMIFIGYVVIGTDNDMYNLPLRRDYEPNKYGIFTPPRSGAADLVLQSNYQVDGGRLNASEVVNGDLQREQTALEEELNRIIPEINKLRKLSLDIKEENALIKERLKILQEQLEDRKRSVFKLKEENENLKRDNQELTNYIKTQENLIREKQAIQTTIKVKPRPNISHGKSAITSKFEQSALRTFLPRTVAKPVTQEYQQNNTIIAQRPIISPAVETEPQEYVITTPAEKTLKPKYLPTVYRTEKVISQQPIIIQAEAPDVTYSTKPNLGFTTQNAVYTYNNIPTTQINEALSYKANIPEQIQEKSYTSSNYPAERDVGYTSAKTHDDDIGSFPYSSSGERNKDLQYTSSGERNKDLPYTSSRERDNDLPYSSTGNRDVPYTSKMNKDKDLPYTSSRERNNDLPYSSTGNRDVPYTSKMNKDKDLPYTSSRERDNDFPYSSTGNRDVPYTSKMNKDKDLPYTSGMNNKDLPYTSKTNRNNNMPYSSSGNRDVKYSSSDNRDMKYSSSGNREKDAPYSSMMAKNIKKDKGYTSSQLNQKDGPYSSQMSTNSNIAGYSSQMANNLGDSTNAGYSSQMAQTTEKYIQGTSNKRPKGSRAPNMNQKRDNNQGDPKIGYSSYRV